MRPIHQKIVALSRLLALREDWKRKKKTVIWTNGCFDLLHIGHVTYLQEARRLGDILVVGVNSDRSYRQWKNRPGPIQPAEHRAALVAALECVDYVVIFDEPSPAGILREFRPDVFVKGGDYSLESVDPHERRTVEAAGGRVHICEMVTGVSTSALIRRILDLYRGHNS
jgi:D-beta-D-heptose 7-phosphate kinase/D-beta-D-heptose 1-phosphate adenosyltransferase